MDKTVVGLIGAVAALSTTAPSQAIAVAPLTIGAAMQASSYADLLSPIPNAAALLKAAATAELRPNLNASPVVGDPAVQEAQLLVARPHHHHHHHHRHWRRRHYHHHHHHHNHY